MRLGILETGEPPPSLASFGSYPAMFATLFGRAGWEFVSFAAREQEYPNDPDDCEAYLVTGSAADAYDDAAWITRLKAFPERREGLCTARWRVLWLSSHGRGFWGQSIESSGWLGDRVPSV